MRFNDIGWILGPSPLFLPGVGISLLVSRLASSRVGRALGVRPGLAFALLLSIGLIVSATLTPSPEEFQYAVGGTGAPEIHATCDLSRIGLPPLESFGSMNDDSLNVLLFLPLGTALALLPGSRRKAGLVVGALAAPFAIETVQLILPHLGRACQASDVADNLTGLAAGLIFGTVVRLVARTTAASST